MPISLTQYPLVRLLIDSYMRPVPALPSQRTEPVLKGVRKMRPAFFEMALSETCQTATGRVPLFCC